MADKYDKTQLDPESTFERHVFHRDQFAHYLRWTHVLKRAKIGSKILDFGCGSGNLAQVLYRNRFKADKYLGLDVRSTTIKNNNIRYEKQDWIKFEAEDLCGDFDHNNDWDIIASFEVIEHIGKQNAPKFLNNISKHCNEETIVLLSTPNFDEKVGAAGNHTYDSGDGRGKAVQEFDHNELKELIEKDFIIVEKYGTFASQTHYKPVLNEWQQKMFDSLSKYYDSNLISVIMAPMFPEISRNCLWVLKKK